MVACEWSRQLRCERLQRLAAGVARYFEVPHHGHQIADEFPRDGDHGDLWPPSHGETVIHRVQAPLRFPRVQRDGRWLPALSHREDWSNLRMQTIRPRGLDEQVATMRVARLGDGSAPLSWSARVFTRHEPEIGHELAWRSKASPIHEFGGQHHRTVHLQATEALQRGHGGA